jgi:hypothetical protein
MNLPTGPSYRKILDTVYRAQLNEQLPDRDAAIALAQTLIDQKDMR